MVCKNNIISLKKNKEMKTKKMKVVKSCGGKKRGCCFVNFPHMSTKLNQTIKLAA